MESSLASSVNKDRPSTLFFRQLAFTLTSTPTREPSVAEFKQNQSSSPWPTWQFGTKSPFSFQSTPRRESTNFCSTTQSKLTSSSLNWSQLSNPNVQHQEFKQNLSSPPSPTWQFGTKRPTFFQSTPRRTSTNFFSTPQPKLTSSSLNSSQLSNPNVHHQASVRDKENELCQLKVNFVYMLLFNSKSPN